MVVSLLAVFVCCSVFEVVECSSIAVVLTSLNKNDDSPLAGWKICCRAVLRAVAFSISFRGQNWFLSVLGVTQMASVVDPAAVCDETCLAIVAMHIVLAVIDTSDFGIMGIVVKGTGLIRVVAGA